MNKRILVLLSSALLAVFLVGTVGAPPVLAAADMSTVHVIQRGETLYSIARSYGVNMMTIARANGITNPNYIYVGQRLVIPTGGAGSGSGRYTGTAHIVQSGETLYSIARSYNTTVAKLQRDNGLSSNLIHPGQKLKLRPGSRSGLGRYQVKAGDTMGKIAKAHNVSLTALLRANGMSSRSTIYPGQWLVIP